MKALNLFTNCRSRAGPSTHFNSNPGSDPDSDPGSDPGSDPSSNPGSDPGFTLSLSHLQTVRFTHPDMTSYIQ